MNNRASVPLSSKEQKGFERSTTSLIEEGFQLQDIADGLRLLWDNGQEAPELQLIQAEILINKTSRCVWNFVHEVLDDRWQERHPETDLIRK